jgi:hypothetical protein
MTRAQQRFIRNYAAHLALIVRERGDGILVLSERYKPERVLGTFDTWERVLCTLDQHCHAFLRAEEKRLRKRRRQVMKDAATDAA